MKMHKHWLFIDNSNRDEILIKQWGNLKEFLEKYPECKITVYNKTVGSMFHKVFCLETNQSYDELDLDVNSMFSGSIRRLERKPANLEVAKEFDFLYSVYTKQTA